MQINKIGQLVSKQTTNKNDENDNIQMIASMKKITVKNKTIPLIINEINNTF